MPVFGSFFLFCAAAAALQAKYNCNILNCKRQKYLSLRCTGKLTKCSVHIFCPSKWNRRGKKTIRTYIDNDWRQDSYHFCGFHPAHRVITALFCARFITNRHSHRITLLCLASPYSFTRSLASIIHMKTLEFSTAMNGIFISFIPSCTRFNLNFHQILCI